MSFLTFPKPYSSRILYIIFSHIKATSLLNHQNLYFFQFYFGFFSTWNKNLSFEVILFFTCLGGKIAKYDGKKSFAWKGEGKKSLYNLSRFTLLEKKETILLEADVDTVSVIEDGKSSLEPLQLQRSIDGS